MRDISMDDRVEQSADWAVQEERERCASIADGLAVRWERSANERRARGQTRFLFIGPAYTTPRAEADAKAIEAAAHGLRTVARLIREGATLLNKSMQGDKT
jgi:hypothetical protein